MSISPTLGGKLLSITGQFPCIAWGWGSGGCYGQVHYAEAGLEIEFIGLQRNDFSFFAPILCPNYPIIAYPCWDHSSWTSVRNLMNGTIKCKHRI